MMITKQQAIAARFFEHGTLCNGDGSPVRARATGKCQTWKTRPDEFKLPVKHGLRDSFYITHENAADWYVSSRRFYDGNYVLGLGLPEWVIGTCTKSGANDAAVARAVKYMRADLATLDAEKVRKELREYGAWSDEELADNEQNLHRLVWVFAGHLNDETSTATQGA